MHKCSNKEARSEGEEEETSCKLVIIWQVLLCVYLERPYRRPERDEAGDADGGHGVLVLNFCPLPRSNSSSQSQRRTSPQHHVLFVQASKRYSDRVLGSLDDLRRLRRALAAGRRLHHEAPRCDLDGVYRESDVLGASDGGGAAAVARQRGEAQRRGESAGGGHGETDKEECVRAIGSPVPSWEKEKVGKGNTVTVAPVGFCDAVVVG